MAKDTGIIGAKGAGFKWNAQSLCGLMMIMGLSAAYYRYMHQIHFNELGAHPAVIMSLPLLTIAWLMVVFPLFMFLSFQDDFKNVNPMVPSNYRDIVIKCYKAMAANNFKVQEKDM